MEELILWNITFILGEERNFHHCINELRPGHYTMGRDWSNTPLVKHEKSTTMIELTEEDAFLLALKANVKIERIEK